MDTTPDTSNCRAKTEPRCIARRVDPLLVGLFAFIVRAALIATYPFVYGGDPIIRLIETDRILLSYQLPGLQVLIYLLHAAGGGVLACRLAVAALSALAGAGLVCLVATRWSRTVAILAGLIFACNPFVLYFSTVPYQFVLVLAAVHWGLYFHLRSRGPWSAAASSLCIGIACLTRYEAWILAACLGVSRIRERMRRQDPSDSHRPWWQTAPSHFLLMGWGPIVWLLWQRGLAPAGTFVIGGIETWGQLLRPLTTCVVLLGLSGPVVLVMAVVGLLVVWREWRSDRHAAWIFAAAWLACSSIGLVFSAHPVHPPSARLNAALRFVGIEPTPAMFVTSREGHLYVSLLCIVVALGIARIGRFRSESVTRRPAWATWTAGLVTLLLLAHGVGTAAYRIDRAGRDPELQTAVAAARVVDPLLDQGGRVVVFAEPIPAQAINDYLDRARRAGGEAGLRRARELLDTIETGPVAYQRMLVHSRHDRRRLLDGHDLDEREGDVRAALRTRDIRYGVVFKGFVARQETVRAAVAVVESGDLVATIDVGVGAHVFAIRQPFR